MMKEQQHHHHDGNGDHHLIIAGIHHRTAAVGRRRRIRRRHSSASLVWRNLLLLGICYHQVFIRHISSFHLTSLSSSNRRHGLKGWRRQRDAAIVRASPPITTKRTRTTRTLLSATTRPRERQRNTAAPTTAAAGQSNNKKKKKQKYSRKNYRLSKSPHQVEVQVEAGLDAMRKELAFSLESEHQSSISDHHNNSTNSSVNNVNNKNTRHQHHAPVVLFPTVRECNAALAALGDSGHLLRALRLFVRMNKAVTLQKQLLVAQPQKSSSNSNTLLGRRQPVVVPAPTLVTYSTLMSRASKTGKPELALRLWRLLVLQKHEPDVRAVNILMNCYAKLADVESAHDLLQQMKTGSGPDVVIPLVPNLVTYNTLLDACLKAGDLDRGLEAKRDLDAVCMRPDIRTYTSLIATVARKHSRSAGQNDPSLAFEFLHEMKEKGIKPNGMTYSALIDVCGRCRRSDLALQGLRMMLRQKAEEKQLVSSTAAPETKDSRSSQTKHSLTNEVGAWTAAINACGRADRIETAIRLFYAMPKFNVEPNDVTCGCLTDCLLRAGRTSETLEVLRFMKGKGIVPTGVMYTSLMTRAEQLLQLERSQNYQLPADVELLLTEDVSSDPVLDDESEDTKAIEIYSELMQSLIEGQRDSPNRSRRTPPKHRPNIKVTDGSDTLLLKVFLVFQQMRAAGATPDLACYNALLRACCRAGDVQRAHEVLDQIGQQGLLPNDISWRSLLRIAASTKQRKSDLALTVWEQALNYGNHLGSGGSRSTSGAKGRPRYHWRPSVDSWSALIQAFLREASGQGVDDDRKRWLYGQVVSFYEDVVSGDDNAMGMDRINVVQLHGNQRTMLLVLQAIVSRVDLAPPFDSPHGFMVDECEERDRLKQMAASILELACFEDMEPQSLSWASSRCVVKARSWAVQRP